MKHDFIIIKRFDHRRGYLYRAYITRRTGAVLSVRAGCRHWRNFEAAFRHYEPNRPRNFGGWPRWSDGWIIGKHGDTIDIDCDIRARMSAHATLTALQEAVRNKQREIRRARK